MRPACGPPPLDGHFVPLPGPALRLLAAPALAPEDLPDVGGVVRDPEGPTDDRGHAGQGPEIGAEALRTGAFEQQLQQAGPLPRREPARSPRGRLRLQPIGASAPDLGLPAADRGGSTTDLPGNFAHPEPLVEEGDGPATPRFQIRGAAEWSHTWESTLVPLVRQESIDRLKGKYQAASDDVMAHLAELRSGMTVEERMAYDERVLAVRTVLELVEQRKKRRLAQRTIADRMEVSQPVIARLEKPFEPSWRQPSLSVLSRYATALGLVLEVRLRPAA